jgi:hypothetical protein
MTLQLIKRRYAHKDERKVLYDRSREEILFLLAHIEKLEGK